MRTMYICTKVKKLMMCSKDVWTKWCFEVECYEAIVHSFLENLKKNIGNEKHKQISNTCFDTLGTSKLKAATSAFLEKRDQGTFLLYANGVISQYWTVAKWFRSTFWRSNVRSAVADTKPGRTLENCKIIQYGKLWKADRNDILKRRF